MGMTLSVEHFGPNNTLKRLHCEDVSASNPLIALVEILQLRLEIDSDVVEAWVDEFMATIGGIAP